MIRVFVRQGLLGQQVERVDFPADIGLTPRTLLDRFADHLPKSVPVRIAVDGALLKDAELDAPIRDEQQVVVLPETGEVIVGVLVQILYMALISAAISYAAYLLSPRPKPQGLAQPRGDESSATYAWDGIKTSYGPGLPIPWGYGRHAVGGQVIWMDASANRDVVTGALDDRLRLILSVMGGQVHRVGDLPAVVRDGLGGFQGGPQGPKIPAGIRINGNLIPDSTADAPGLKAWLRPGTMDQPALPAPFDGVRQLFSPNLQLNAQGDTVVFTWSGTEQVTSLVFVMAAPNGLYRQDATGNLTFAAVVLGVRWRRPGASTWMGSVTITPSGVTQPVIGYFAQTFSIATAGAFPGPSAPPIFGPLEIQVSRSTPATAESVTQILWRDLIVSTPHTLRYPGEALLGLELQAGARFEGGQPQITVPLDLELVRVWDEDDGWSPRCWDVPAPPFAFNTYPPGRNPAWIALDYLLAEHGLGRWITEDKIDLQAFRNWAAFCDQDPNPADPWGEASFCCDIVGDSPKPAWEWVLQIFAAGRAVPVMRNGKISVVYQYRDAHWDLGGGGAPAKTSTQLITSGNCEDVQVTWSSQANRTTVMQFQFLNEAKAWEQDTLQVPDLEGTLHDPTALRQDQWRSEDVQAYGVTRASQIYREGVWRHRIGRLVRREISFLTGPWTLAAEVGDVVDFEHELMRPFDADVPVSMQVVQFDAGVPNLVVDHHLAGTGLQICVRDPDGVPQRRNIVSFTNGTLAGRNVSTCVLSAALSPAVGATCVVGKVDKLVEPYQIVSITLQKDLKRQVRAIQWTPEAYDPITKDSFLGLIEEADLSRGVSSLTVEVEDTDQDLPPNIFGVSVVPTGSGHLARWRQPGGYQGAEVAIYLQRVDGGEWVLAGKTTSEQMLLQLRTGDTYRISICIPGQDGATVSPETGDQLQFLAEEFPGSAPPAITGARANIVEDDLLVQWDDMQQRSIDYVEVRAGSNWTAARVLARERSPRATIPEPPAGVPLLLAARASSGLYGPIVQIAAPGWTPPNVVQRLLEDDLAPSPAGAHSGTQWNATDLVLELQSGVLSGTYTSVELDRTFQAPWFWQVRIDAEEIEDGLVSELDDEPGIGEALWALVSGRPASPASPGLDWRERVQDDDMPVGDDPATNLVRGPVGVVGSHTQAQVESRFYVDGAWTAYRPHVDGVVLASRMQVRVTLGRRSLRYRVRVRLLTYTAYL